MNICTSIPSGQLRARTRWNTHESGAAFDRKKTPYLTEEAQQFIAQQSYFVIAWSGPQNDLHASLVMGRPGAVQTPDKQTCVLHIPRSPEHVILLQGLQESFRRGYLARPGLFFISHSTRERLCVQGSVRMLIADTASRDTLFQEHENMRVLMHVDRSFFHCSKYIRTRIAGLTCPATVRTGQGHQGNQGYLQQCLFLQGQHQDRLTREVNMFLRQQVLCFLCTIDEDGQCAVNHRGGAPGFIVTLLPVEDAPGGIILLPDYVGNGAFEAAGNVLETGLATLLIPNYATQVAVEVAGTARILGTAELTPAMARLCPGAERVLALTVQRVSVQSADWSATLASERARAEYVFANGETTDVCSL